MARSRPYGVDSSDPSRMAADSQWSGSHPHSKVGWMSRYCQPAQQNGGRHGAQVREVRGVRHLDRSGPGPNNGHGPGGRDTIRPIGHQRSARHGSAPANRTGLPVTVPEGGSGGVRRRFRIGAHRGARGRRACRSAAPACPTDDHGPGEQVALVNQPGLEGLRSEVRTSYGEIAAGRGLQFVYGGGVEVAFEFPTAIASYRRRL